MKNFTNFIISKTYNPISIPDDYINLAFRLAKNDYLYHFPDLTEETVYSLITSSGEGLPVYLYRLGSAILNSNFEHKNQVLHNLHWVMRQYCSCEIYFNNTIGVGFLVVHGLGTVIGSRNEIGEGFVIHQGCTIGHKKNGMGKISGKGSKFGNNVKIYVNSTIIGELNIGNNVIIGAHSLVLEDIPDNSVVKNKRNQESRILY